MSDTQEMVARMTTIDFLENAFRNIDLPTLSSADLLDIAYALAAYRASQLAGVVGERDALEARLAKYEGPDAGSWFYPDGDTSSDACCHSAYEVLDERYFDYGDGPRTGVFPIERAIGLPKLYAAVRAYSEVEKDKRGSDDDYDATFHLTEEEARAALGAKL